MPQILSTWFLHAPKSFPLPPFMINVVYEWDQDARVTGWIGEMVIIAEFLNVAIFAWSPHCTRYFTYHHPSSETCKAHCAKRVILAKNLPLVPSISKLTVPSGEKSIFQNWNSSSKKPKFIPRVLLNPVYNACLLYSTHCTMGHFEL